MAQQTTGNTQTSQAPAAQPAARAGRETGPKPMPVVPPEFDALPIWTMDAPKLVAMLKDPDSTEFQKAIACKKLSIVGGKEAVAADGRAAQRSASRPAMRGSAWSRIPTRRSTKLSARRCRS